ncbi:MAG: restriction endonuclease subunit S [Gammaproteobacteria bacterium]|nr:MAG: restriction endonuclease subunit S [Gammaproteobacteria bacterium]
MRWPGYSGYKESGVRWVEKIPEQWDTISLKWVSRRYAGGTPDKSNPAYWEDGDIPWLNSGSVNDGYITEPSAYITREGFANSSAKWIPENALVMALAGQGKTKGMVAQLGIEATCNQSMAAIIPKPNVLPRYLYWWLVSNYQNIRNMAGGEQRDGLNLEMLGSIPCPLGSVEEQNAIANFLDRETEQIDTLVAKKRRLIALLKEKRTALISRTVTRGLPEDAAREFGLEPPTRFKDSGIEWLGEVPEGWAVKAVKWETSVQRGASPRPIDDPVYFDDEGEYSWVRIADVTKAGMYLEDTEQKLSELGSSLSVKMQPGSLFLSIAGTVGKPCITNIKCCIHDGFVYFPRWKGEPRYLYYIFASGEPYKGLGKMGTQLNLNTDTVGSIVIGIPNDEEQLAIANYLDHETAKIDRLVEKVEAAIACLQEYRTALITAAVTGTIDVREAAA